MQNTIKSLVKVIYIFMLLSEFYRINIAFSREKQCRIMLIKISVLCQSVCLVFCLIVKFSTMNMLQSGKIKKCGESCQMNATFKKLTSFIKTQTS